MMKPRYLGFLALVSSFALVAGQVEYGEKCTTGANTWTSDCFSADELNYLVCSGPINVDGICKCKDATNGGQSPAMFFHQTLRRCVSPHDGDCWVRANNGSRIMSCTEFAYCRPNTVAGTLADPTPGKCVCEGNSEPHASGECKLRHGATGCNRNSDCNTDIGLSCQDSVCLCADSKFLDGNMCKTIYEGACNDGNDCGSGMTCSTDKKCACSEGRTPHPITKQSCGFAVGDDCDDTKKCHDVFECPNSGNADRKCGCRDNLHPSEKTCAILSGEACTDINHNFTCIANSECDNTGKCACEEGYQAKGDKTCGGAFGKECNNSTNTEDGTCFDKGYLVCQGQANNENKCGCRNGYEHEGGDALGCKGKLSSRCEEDIDCMGALVCRTGTENKFCGCPAGQEASPDNQHCYVNFNDKCDSNTECNPNKNYKCNETISTCDCKSFDDQLYEQSKDRCVSKGGKQCAATDECVAFAECKSSVCECNKGKPNDEGRCNGGSSLIAGSLLLALVMMVHGKMMAF